MAVETGLIRAASIRKSSGCVYAFLAGLVSTVFAGQAALMGLPIAPHRVFFGVAILLLCLELRDYPMQLPRLRSIHLLMAMMVIWAMASAIAVGSIYTSLGFYALLDRLVLPFAFFTIAPLVFRTRGRRDMLLKCLVLLGLYLAFTAVFEMVGPRQLIFPSYIGDPSLGIQFGRARGPFLAAEADGLTMLTCTFACWFAVRRFNGLWRNLSALGCLMCSLGCLLTLTRSIWLGFVLALLVAGLQDPSTRRKLPVIATILVVGAGLALAGVPGLHKAATERASTSRSVMDRQNTNAAAIRVIEQKPLVGVGWVRFIEVNQDYVRQSDEIPITNIRIEVHNVLLGRAAELGIPAAALWLLCVFKGPVEAVWRRRRYRGDIGPVDLASEEAYDIKGELNGWTLVLTATLCAWGVTVMLSPVPYPLPNLLVWLLGGVVLASTNKEQQLIAQPTGEVVS